MHTPRCSKGAMADFDDGGSYRKPPKRRGSSLGNVRAACLERIKRDRDARRSSGRPGLSPEAADGGDRRGRARAILDDVLGSRTRPRGGGQEVNAAMADASHPDARRSLFEENDDDEGLSPEEEAALVAELEAELKAYELERADDVAHELAMEALSVEAAGLAFDADEDGPDVVLCPVCSSGYLREGRSDQSVACTDARCGLTLPDQLDGVGLDHLRALLAETFASHAAACGSRPTFAIDDLDFLAATCPDCGFHRIIL